MNCPHCGDELLSPVYPISAERYDFACGTVHVPSSSASPVRGPRCYERQISQLRAELSQCVRRDDPRLREALDWFNSRNFASNIAANIYDSISGK